MNKELHDILAHAFICPANVSVGDRVKISAANTVALLTDPADSVYDVGEVTKHQADDLKCTVATPYRRLRDNRISGAAVPVGPFVFGAANAVFGYSPAAAARHDGTATGPVDVTLDTDDVVKVKINGASQTVQLSAGTDVTFETIAAELTAGLNGITAEVDADGNINLVCDELGKTIEVETVTHDAYTLLGWSEAIYYPTNASHDQAAIRGMAIKPATAAGQTVETLEY